MMDEIETSNSSANYYFMIWKERGRQDWFAFMEKSYWDKAKYL